MTTFSRNLIAPPALCISPWFAVGVIFMVVVRGGPRGQDYKGQEKILSYVCGNPQEEKGIHLRELLEREITSRLIAR